MLSSVFAASHVQKAHDAQDVRAPLAHNDYPLPHRRPVRPLVMRHAQPASAACRNGCNYACTLGCRYVLLPERPNAKSPAFAGRLESERLLRRRAQSSRDWLSPGSVSPTP